jgi:hypothetical protein
MPKEKLNKPEEAEELPEIQEDSELVDLLNSVSKSQKPPEQKALTAEPKSVVEPQLSPAPEPPPLPPATLTKVEVIKDDLGIKKLIGKFTDSVDVIISNQGADRQQAENTFAYLDNLIRTAFASNVKVSPSIIEAWVKSMQIKSDINANAVGALDSIAKLLAAAKKHDLIINLGGGADPSGIDLAALLAQPDDKDDDFDL